MKSIPKCHPDKPYEAKGLCKQCYNKKWNNSEEHKAYQKEYYKTEKRKAYLKEYSKSDKYLQFRKEFDTSEKRRAYNRVLNNTKRKENIQFKLSQNLRNRLRNGIKTGSFIRDLGCTIAELKDHLESLFQPGMTWENYGIYGWHVDHKVPLASFDLTDREQFLKACHYSNLQPLWASDNLRKGAKIL